MAFNIKKIFQNTAFLIVRCCLATRPRKEPKYQLKCPNKSHLEK